MHARLCSLIAALLFLLALPGVSRAQAPGGTASPADHVVLQDEKSPLVAFGLPIAVTSLSVLVTIPGYDPVSAAGVVLMVVGPSAGHVYAGETRTALVQTGVRAVASVAFFAGAAWWSRSDCPPFSFSDCDAPAGPPLLMLGSFVVGTGSAIYSIIDAPSAAHRHNRKVRAQQLFITPAPMVGPDRSTGLGLQLGGRF